MNERQKRFCQYYIELGNIAKASIKAGYSKNTGSKLMNKKEIKDYIDVQLKKMEDKRIAKASEVMKYLTSVMRGEINEEVIVLEASGSGYSNARNVTKQSSVRERLRAAELLGKRYSIFSDKLNYEINTPIFIAGEQKIKE